MALGEQVSTEINEVDGYLLGSGMGLQCVMIGTLYSLRGGMVELRMDAALGSFL